MTEKEYPNPLVGKTVEAAVIFHFHKGKNGRTYVVNPLRPTKNCHDGRCALISVSNIEVLRDYALGEGEVFQAWKSGVRDVSSRHQELVETAKRHGINWGENKFPDGIIPANPPYVDPDSGLSRV